MQSMEDARKEMGISDKDDKPLKQNMFKGYRIGTQAEMSRCFFTLEPLNDCGCQKSRLVI